MELPQSYTKPSKYSVVASASASAFPPLNQIIVRVYRLRE